MIQYKEEALRLRKKGYTYGEILKRIPVSKSTLSNYVKDLELTEQEKHYLKFRKTENISRGRIRAAAANHAKKLSRDRGILEEAKREFDRFASEPLFLIGIALYWAEGAKRNTFFAFTNSDPDMIALMVLWMRRYLKVEEEEIKARLFVHKQFVDNNFEAYWSKTAGIPMDNFGKTIIKSTEALVKKRPNYKGCLRVELGKVVYLRKMTFLQKMLIAHYLKDR